MLNKCQNQVNEFILFNKVTLRILYGHIHIHMLCNLMILSLIENFLKKPSALI